MRIILPPASCQLLQFAMDCIMDRAAMVNVNIVCIPHALCTFYSARPLSSLSSNRPGTGGGEGSGVHLFFSSSPYGCLSNNNEDLSYYTKLVRVALQPLMGGSAGGIPI